jgi:ribosomal protein L29
VVTRLRDYPRYPDEEVELRQQSVKLTLSLARMLEATARLRQSASMSEVRQQISRFKEQLERPTPLDPNEVIELSREFLYDAFEQIAAAHTLERARYYIERLEKSLTKVKTSRINDINLNRWKEYNDIYTDSLWVVPRRDRSGTHRADYWGNFIPQIPNQLLKRYTKQGDWVLDTFAGLGTTLIESQRLGRNGLGIELQPHITERANNRIAGEPNPHAATNEVICADSLQADYKTLLAERGVKSVQLAIMHPPYHDIIRFSENPADLSNAATIESFLEGLGQVVENVYPLLERGRYLALVIGDKFARSEWIPLGFMAMNAVQERGFALKSIVVKNFEDTTGKRAQQELWKYRALVGGFYIFKHEYIFVFRKK